MKSMLKTILNEQIDTVEEMAGGSAGSTYLVITQSGKKYVYKLDSADIIHAQIKFYKEYNDLPYLPTLVYVADDETSMIIEYLDYEQVKPVVNKTLLIGQLIEEFISKYKVVESDFFGYVGGDLKVSSYSEFLIKEAKLKYELVSDLVSEKDFADVIQSIENIFGKDEFNKKYLLHGDFGFHNFSYSSKEVNGIIDPDSAIGHPMYDLLYCFCSTPVDLSLASLDELLLQFTKYFPFENSDSKSLLKIALLQKIPSCRRHHPKDLELYMDAWKELL